jgi:hypothetical protein
VVVDDPQEKVAALARFVDAILPGRAAESRESDRNELAATLLLRLRIEEASAKVRSGGPRDDPADRDLPLWAGVVPQQTRFGAAIPADDCDLPLPPSVQRLLDGANP